MAHSVRNAEDSNRFGLVDIDGVRENRIWFYGLGIVFVLLGVLAMSLPFAASMVTAVVLGSLMVIGGLFQFIHAIQNRRWGGSFWAIVGALLHVIAGTLIILYPVTGTLALTLILGVFFVANGILKMIRAVQHRKTRAWGWLLFDGLVTLALGALIAARWPATAAWALGLLVGIDLLISGWSMILIGFTAGAMARRPAHVTGSPPGAAA
jgi:uncharacterized membrane protein HdeD (DUF308 family)